jgi:hypothetical protein
VRNDLVVLILATAASCPLGLALGQPWLLPVLNALPGFLVLLHRLRKGERGGAVRAMLWWAATVAIAGTLAMILWPGAVDGLVVAGPARRAETLAWLHTGHDVIGSLRLFLPRHLALVGVFVVLSLASASAVSLVLGAALLNAVSFSVASLAAAGVPDWAVAVFGWPPWTIAEAAGLATLATVLAEPLLFRLFPGARQRLKVVGRMPYYIAALSGLLGGWFLQATLAPLWGHWLRHFLR